MDFIHSMVFTLHLKRNVLWPSVCHNSDILVFHVVLAQPPNSSFVQRSIDSWGQMDNENVLAAPKRSSGAILRVPFFAFKSEAFKLFKNKIIQKIRVYESEWVSVHTSLHTQASSC